MEAMQQKGCEWIAVQTAVTGKMHLKKQIVCQDKTFVYETSDVFAAALADGASSAAHSELGAQTVVTEVCKILAERFDEFYNSKSEWMVKSQILSHLLKKLEETASANHCERSALASTLMAVAISKDCFLMLQLGDGVLSYAENQKVRLALLPQNGEFVSETYFVTSLCAIEKMRIKKGDCSSIDGFALMSDGSAASLYSRRRQEVAPVLARLIGRLGMTSKEYMEPILQESIENVVAKRTDDDCSLILISKHIKSYDELDQSEGRVYFEIQLRRDCDAVRRMKGYQNILNALDSKKSSKELCELMGRKDVRSFVKNWLAPLIELGYITEVQPDVYKRLIHPRCSVFTSNIY